MFRVSSIKFASILRYFDESVTEVQFWLPKFPIELIFSVPSFVFFLGPGRIACQKSVIDHDSKHLVAMFFPEARFALFVWVWGCSKGGDPCVPKQRIH